MAKIVQFPGPGCVVEFMQGNAPQIAWVLEEQSGKLRLLLPNRRETPLPASRLLPWAGPQHAAGKSREDAIALLLAIKARREAIEAGLNPADLWDMAQGEVDKAGVQWLAELAFTDPDVDEVAALGHALLACKSHFRFNPPDFEIFSAETVTLRQQAEEAAREREAMVDGGAAWFRQLWDSRQNHKPLSSPETAAPPEPVRSRLARMLERRILDPQSQDDEALWKQVIKGLPDDPHLPLLLAMSWGLVPEHYNYWLARAEYAPGDAWAGEFAEETGEMIAALRRERREPLDEAFISIDGASTRDRDDAFRVEPRQGGGWNIAVVLACPACRWPFGSPLDKAVRGRASSLYLPEGDYHMMPEILGAEAFSLHAGQAVPALIARCAVDGDGVVLDCRPELAWVSLAANLNYTDCEAALNRNPAPAAGANPALAWADQLEAALALAYARQAYRVARGAVIIERPDVSFSLKGEGADTQVFLKEEEPAPQAQFLVAEIMILANEALAAWALDRDLPLLFRTQDVAVPPGFAGLWRSPPDIARVVKAMAPALLELTPRPHAGMGLKAYISATSPLRRYCDLVNEAQIAAWLRDGAPRWSREELHSLLSALNPGLEAVGLVQRFRPRYWKLLYIQQQARRHGDACLWEATVSEANEVFVNLSLEREQVLVRGKRALFAPFGDTVQPGRKFRLRLGKISPLRGDLSIMAVREADEASFLPEPQASPTSGGPGTTNTAADRP